MHAVLAFNFTEKRYGGGCKCSFVYACAPPTGASGSYAGVGAMPARSTALRHGWLNLARISFKSSGVAYKETISMWWMINMKIVYTISIICIMKWTCVLLKWFVICALINKMFGEKKYNELVWNAKSSERHTKVCMQQHVINTTCIIKNNTSMYNIVSKPVYFM